MPRPPKMILRVAHMREIREHVGKAAVAEKAARQGNQTNTKSSS